MVVHFVINNALKGDVIAASVHLLGQENVLTEKVNKLDIDLKENDVFLNKTGYFINLK